jgi:hypothetical protein
VRPVGQAGRTARRSCACAAPPRSRTPARAAATFSLSPAKLSRRDRRKLHRRHKLGVRAISVEKGEFGDKTTAQKLALIERR